MTTAQRSRVEQTMREYSGSEPVELDFVDGDTLYVFTSELGALRIWKRYGGTIGSVGYSKNLSTWFFEKPFNVQTVN